MSENKEYKFQRMAGGVIFPTLQEGDISIVSFMTVAAKDPIYGETMKLYNVTTHITKEMLDDFKKNPETINKIFVERHTQQLMRALTDETGMEYHEPRVSKYLEVKNAEEEK